VRGLLDCACITPHLPRRDRDTCPGAGTPRTPPHTTLRATHAPVQEPCAPHPTPPSAQARPSPRACWRCRACAPSWRWSPSTTPRSGAARCRGRMRSARAGACSPSGQPAPPSMPHTRLLRLVCAAQSLPMLVALGVRCAASRTHVARCAVSPNACCAQCADLHKACCALRSLPPMLVARNARTCTKLVARCAVSPQCLLRAMRGLAQSLLRAAQSPQCLLRAARTCPCLLRAARRGALLQGLRLYGARGLHAQQPASAPLALTLTACPCTPPPPLPQGPAARGHAEAQRAGCGGGAVTAAMHVGGVCMEGGERGWKGRACVLPACAPCVPRCKGRSWSLASEHYGLACPHRVTAGHCQEQEGCSTAGLSFVGREIIQLNFIIPLDYCSESERRPQDGAGLKRKGNLTFFRFLYLKYKIYS